jgi:hypothetical protein
MAAKLSKSLFRGGGRNALDLPVAGLSALAAAFAAFAIPQEILSRAVVATGLPRLLSAAQPPLGLTARVALAIGGALLVFGIVLLALRLLDRSGLGANEEQDDENRSGPRVRRRDGHPDAPAPRPISAARDLGEPAPPHAPRAELPLWLDEAEPAAQPFGVAPEPAVEPEPEREPTPEPEPVAEADPWSAPGPQAFPEPTPAPVIAHDQGHDDAYDHEPEPWPELEAAFERMPEATLSSLPEPASEPQPEPVAVAAPAPVPEVAHVAVVEPARVPAPVAAAAPAPAAPQPEMPTSIAGLMERLEQGLAKRRRIQPVPAPAPEPASAGAAPEVFPDAPDVAEVFAAPEPFEAADDRLQSAIASLQRLAARSA